MKPCVRGKTVYLREVASSDSEFILALRTDAQKSKYLHSTDSDIRKQEEFIEKYQSSMTDFYFIICDWEHRQLGTVRIYDVRGDSFCWGSWILSADAPANAAIESALLLYDFAFYSLHYAKSHFDVRKENKRVVDFHLRFGAVVVSEDAENFYFEYPMEKYLTIRNKYRRYIP